MKISRFIRHFNDRNAALLLYLKRTIEMQDMEDIHKLRVTIKKLRAIWSLMEITSHGRFTKKEHLTLFSTLFNTAGDVRDAQVSLSLILQNKARYLNNFIRKIENQQEQRQVRIHGKLIQYLTLQQLKSIENLS